MTAHRVSRRLFLSTGGALVVGFAISPAVAQPQKPEQNGDAQADTAQQLPGSLQKAPYLDSWIAIDAKNGITVFTGKAELGQGIKTTLIQCAAEQLNVDFAAIKLVTADTERTPNEGYTAGSHSMQDSGTAILNAAAQVRGILIDLAAARFNMAADQLKAQGGKVTAPDGQSVSYGELVNGQDLHRMAQPTSPLKDPKDFSVMGKPVPRIDIPGKLTGGAMYVQDMRMNGMLHARVVRPPSYGAQLLNVDTAAVQKMPGVVNVVRDGSFLAVVANGEFQAIDAMNALSAAAQWHETAQLPEQRDIHQHLESLPIQDQTIDDRGDPNEQGVRVLKARYSRRISRTAPSGRRARSRSITAASSPCGRIPRAFTRYATRSPTWCISRKAQCAASMSRAPAATGRTARTTWRRMWR